MAPTGNLGAIRYYIIAEKFARRLSLNKYLQRIKIRESENNRTLFNFICKFCDDSIGD